MPPTGTRGSGILPSMRDVVRAAAERFQTRYEGRLSFMYLDRLGLVTTAIGNKIDPVTDALRLPWRANNVLATPDQITAEWCHVKSLKGLAQAGGDAFLHETVLRLLDPDIDELFQRTLDGQWGYLWAAYPEADQWPAAAQLGALSMEWAMGAGRIVPGPAFEYPRWRAAALAQDWAECARQCTMWGVGIESRNAEQKALFEAALTLGPDQLPEGV
jgi:GH24 family phage-related lysozyme (muramidase)